MRDYQVKKNNRYALPRTLYRRVVHLVKDYDRLKDDYHDLLNSTPPALSETSSLKGSYISNPTERKALRLSLMGKDLEAVEQALILIPNEYRESIFDHIKYSTPYPDYAGISTYKRWKQLFLYHVAENLGLI